MGVATPTQLGDSKYIGGGPRVRSDRGVLLRMVI